MEENLSDEKLSVAKINWTNYSVLLNYGLYMESNKMGLRWNTSGLHTCKYNAIFHGSVNGQIYGQNIAFVCLNVARF